MTLNLLLSVYCESEMLTTTEHLGNITCSECNRNPAVDKYGEHFHTGFVTTGMDRDFDETVETCCELNWHRNQSIFV